MHDLVSDPGGLLIACHCALRSAAFRPINAVGFLPDFGIILMGHNYTFFGAQYRPCILVPPGFGLPLPGLPAGFPTALLAKLWTGGTWGFTPLTHWVALTNFIPDYGNPKVPDLSRHDN